MKALIVCDIDGVLLDHRHRDHLIPAGGQTGNNKHWLEHQHPDVVAMDPVLAWNAYVVASMERGMDGCRVVFLTSRLEINRRVTKESLRRAGFTVYNDNRLRMRQMDEHDDPATFKVKAMAEILRRRTDTGHVIFIEDSQANIDAVMAAHHDKNGVSIHPILLRP
jgi:hypothetical protein